MAERPNKRERQHKSQLGAAASPVAPHRPPGRGCPLPAGPLLPAPAETSLRGNPRWAAAHLRGGPSAGGRAALAPRWPLRHLPRRLADPSPPPTAPGARTQPASPDPARPAPAAHLKAGPSPGARPWGAAALPPLLLKSFWRRVGAMLPPWPCLCPCRRLAWRRPPPRLSQRLSGRRAAAAAAASPPPRSRPALRGGERRRGERRPAQARRSRRQPVT